MRHGKRHLSYAVSTVLGLAAPALAAVLLTSSTPGLAAVLPAASVAADTDHPNPSAHVPAFHAAKAVVKHAAPVAKPAAPKPTVHRTSVRTVAKSTTRTVRRTTTTTAPKTTTTSTNQTAQPWGSDDYPYRTQSDFYAIDKWGFTERQCVSFAAWRLAEHGHAINNSDNWGSAFSWDDTARRLGYTVTTKAHVGAIAQWNSHESGAYYSKGSSKPNGTFAAGGYGHVGWVKQVYADGSALVEQYNMGGDRAYSVMRVKAPRYIVL